MISVKQATLSDVHHFVSLGHEMHRESVFQFLPFDHVLAADTARRHIEDDNCCAFLVFKNDEAIGMHLASLTNYFFSPAKLAAGLVTYVKINVRGGRAALLLIKAFIEWAKANNADEAYIGVSVGVKLHSTDKFFRHFGFSHVGGNYKLRL